MKLVVTARKSVVHAPTTQTMPKRKIPTTQAAPLKVQGKDKKRTPQSAFDPAAGKDVYEPSSALLPRCTVTSPSRSAPRPSSTLSSRQSTLRELSGTPLPSGKTPVFFTPPSNRSSLLALVGMVKSLHVSH